MDLVIKTMGDYLVMEIIPADWKVRLAQYKDDGAPSEMLEAVQRLLALVYSRGIGKEIGPEGDSRGGNLHMKVHPGGNMTIRFMASGLDRGFVIMIICKADGKLYYSQTISDLYAGQGKGVYIDDKGVSIEDAVNAIVAAKMTSKCINDILSGIHLHN